MKKIYLRGNNSDKYVLVDDGDFEWLNQSKWYLNTKGYASNNKHIRMHRLINKTPQGLLTDHKNGDKLDNRRSNLRTCNNSENHCNIKLMANNTSGHKGVSWSKAAQKWHAYINKDSKRTYLGIFNNLDEAVKVYEKAAVEQHGEFVNL